MKVLFVAMSGSIHTVRWINQLNNQGWDLYLFPSYDNRGIHDKFNDMDIKIYRHFTWLVRFFEILKLKSLSIFLVSKFVNFNSKYKPNYYAKKLAKYIELVQPDIIHSMETQGGGYLVYDAKVNYWKGEGFPIWWHSNWGSDIYLFGRLISHQNKIAQVIQSCNYYSCESDRDKLLAQKFGFKGIFMPIYPASGGLDIDLVGKILLKAKKPSKRKIIMLKGYQGWAGRALVGIRALEICGGKLLKGYTLVIFSNSDGIDVAISAELLSQSVGLKVVVLPDNTDHKIILEYQSMARISIGLSISDGVPSSLLEAMALGSFPIQSDTASTSGWIENGKTGFVVPAENPSDIANAISTCLANDDLVDDAANLNLNKIVENANRKKLSIVTINSYINIFQKSYV